MRRRALLSLTGSCVAGLAGCLSGAAPDAVSGTATESNRTTSGTATNDTATSETATSDATERDSSTRTTEETTLSVGPDALQPGLVTQQTADSIGVSRDDGQFLYLAVSATGPAPLREEFAFEFDGSEYAPEPIDRPWRIWRFYGDEERIYDGGTGEGLLLFELPESAGSADADDSADNPDAAETVEVALTWPGGEWQPDDALRRRLATPEPSLSVSAEIPETIPASEQPTITLTVRNESDVAGRFVAGLNRSGPMITFTPVRRISFLVPAGESETWKLTDGSIMSADYPDENVGDGEPDMTYHLDWPGERISRKVRYAD